MLDKKTCMDATTPKISVIIPIFQHWELTEGLFKALDQQTQSKSHWECFIVDNGSDVVPSEDSLPSFITLLECDTPGSYAARNKALKHAKGELLVFTDADCQPDPQWLERIWSTYQRQSSPALIAGGVTVKKFLPGKLNPVEVYDIAMGLPQDRYTQRGFAVTANLSTPRLAFDRVGNFGEKRYSGGDMDFCLRSKKAGIPLVYIPEANVNHPARDSWDALTCKMKRVKGGQLLCGTGKQKRSYIIKTLVPPISRAWYAATTHKTNLPQKWTTLWMLGALWLLEIKITFKILATGEKERR